MTANLRSQFPAVGANLGAMFPPSTAPESITLKGRATVVLRERSITIEIENLPRIDLECLT